MAAAPKPLAGCVPTPSPSAAAVPQPDTLRPTGPATQPLLASIPTRLASHSEAESLIVNLMSTPPTVSPSELADATMRLPPSAQHLLVTSLGSLVQGLVAEVEVGRGSLLDSQSALADVIKRMQHHHAQAQAAKEHSEKCERAVQELALSNSKLRYKLLDRHAVQRRRLKVPGPDAAELESELRELAAADFEPRLLATGASTAAAAEDDPMLWLVAEPTGPQERARAHAGLSISGASARPRSACAAPVAALEASTRQRRAEWEEAAADVADAAGGAGAPLPTTGARDAASARVERAARDAAASRPWLARAEHFGASRPAGSEAAASASAATAAASTLAAGQHRYHLESSRDAPAYTASFVSPAPPNVGAAASHGALARSISTGGCNRPFSAKAGRPAAPPGRLGRAASAAALRAGRPRTAEHSPQTRPPRAAALLPSGGHMANGSGRPSSACCRTLSLSADALFEPTPARPPPS